MTDRGPFSFEFLETLGVPLRRLTAGERLFRAGDPGQYMYVVTKGEVEITISDLLVETVGEHGVLGEMALIDREPRSATATARTACELMEIDRDNFLALVSEYPSFSLYVMKLMTGRIRRMNERR
ncbi:MAG: Crp/Fnr family transcriptional regulator [Hyphomicrobium sp.]